MNRALAVVIVLLAACGAKKDKDQEKQVEPTGDDKPALDAGKAAATPDAGKAAVAATDGGAVVVATADAGPPAADAMPSKPAEAGALYLLGEAPLGASIVIAELYAKPAAEGGEFEFGYENDDGRLLFQVAQRFTTPDPAHAELVGKRFALWGIGGRKCAGTVKEVLAVSVGGVWGELKKREKEPKDTPDLVATLVKEANSWHVAASLTDVEGDCADAVFAIADGVKPKLIKVKAAKDWEDAAEAAYDATSRVQDAHAKQELEGEGAGVKMVSVRRLAAASGPSLALVYAMLNDHRTIGVFSVPGPTFEGAKFFGSVDAESPSEVVGGDFDGDGLLDVVIEHATGVALVRGNGEGQTIVDYEVNTPLD